MRRDQHIRLTPNQRRLLQIVRSFGPRGATERQISLRAERKRGQIGGRR